MIPMEFTVLGSIPLGVWVVGLSEPSDSVDHILHDGDTLNELDIEVVFGNPSMVSL